MEVKVLSSRLVKPAYKAGAPATEYIPLSIFDTVTYQIQMAIIYAFAPSTAAIEKGLAAVLAQYRAFAGQLGESPDGAPAVVLNDRGARLVEASVDADLVDMAPAKPTPALLKLHPDLDAEHEEVVVLQLTRFRCGSLAVGFTSKHVVADGHATSNFLVAWGRATRGLPMGVPPVHHQKDLFKPRPSPARLEHDHRSREYHRPSPTAAAGHHQGDDGADNGIVIHKAHFTKDFIAGLRAKASEGRGRPFSRFETILAHLWRTMTRARDLSPGEATSIRISVDGRHRLGRPAEYFGNLVLWAFPRTTVGDLLSQPLKHAAQTIHDEVARVDGGYFQSFVDFASTGAAEYFGNLVLWAFPRTTVGDLLSQPLKHAAQTIHDEVARVDGGYFQSFVDFASTGAAEYFGNLVLWAFPRTTVGDLLSQPLKHAAQTIHDEVARVDGGYFQSFVDFASTGAAEKEGLAPSAVLKDVVCPDVEVDSWLTFPFYELDFGTGSPSYFMPSYFPTEGMLFLAPSYLGDGSVDAFVPVFQHNLQAFKECCYSME